MEGLWKKQVSGDVSRKKLGTSKKQGRMVSRKRGVEEGGHVKERNLNQTEKTSG